MDSSACPHCNTVNEGQELYCPACGKTTIPQLDKKQLRTLVDREDASGLNTTMGLGCLAGGLLGILVLATATEGMLEVIRGGEPDPDNTIRTWVNLSRIPCMTAFLGCIVGLIFSLMRRKKRLRSQPRKPERGHG